MVRYGWLCEIFRALQKAGGDAGLTKELFVTALRTMIDVTAQEPSTPAMESRIWDSMSGRERVGKAMEEGEEIFFSI